MSYKLKFVSGNPASSIKRGSIDETHIYPDFMVVTGKNGSGKSHFLMSIASHRMKIENICDVDRPNVSKYFNYQSFSPRNGDAQNEEIISYKKSAAVRRFRDIKNDMQKNPAKTLEDYRKVHGIEIDIFIDIELKLNKKFINLSEDDISNNYPTDGRRGFDSPIQYAFENQFTQYLKKYKVEEQKFVLSHRKITPEESERQFKKTYEQPPWESINFLLREMGSKYQLNNPLDKVSNARFEIKLVDRDGLEITFEQLSSGEKIMMSLIIILDNKDNGLILPSVLLLDEVDASLHPSLAKEFLDFLMEVFVKKFGIKVILATHSPTTVALAPDKSIYIMRPDGNRLQQATKKEALSYLTEDLHALSVNFDKRKQVLVESHADIEFYETAFNALTFNKPCEYDLKFITRAQTRPNGRDENGGCPPLVEMLNMFRNAGNENMYGIIDYDNKNESKPNKNLFVFGENKRYSIENYLFDPLIYSIFLIQENKKNLEDFGLNQIVDNLPEINNLDKEQLQIIVNNFFVLIGDNRPDGADKSSVTVQLINDIELDYEKWFLATPGHGALEAIICSSFFPNGSAKGFGAINKKIVSSTFRPYKKLLSKDFDTLFNKFM